MRRVVLSVHAEGQIAERKLDRQAVLEVVTDPEEVIPSGGRWVAQKIVYSGSGKRYLMRVVYEEREDVREVVTVYRTSKLAKYRRVQ